MNVRKKKKTGIDSQPTYNINLDIKIQHFDVYRVKRLMKCDSKNFFSEISSSEFFFIKIKISFEYIEKKKITEGISGALLISDTFLVIISLRRFFLCVFN